MKNYKLKDIANNEQITVESLQSLLRRFPIFDNHLGQEGGEPCLSENGTALLFMLGYEGLMNTYNRNKRDSQYVHNKQSPIKQVIEEIG